MGLLHLFVCCALSNECAQVYFSHRHTHTLAKGISHIQHVSPSSCVIVFKLYTQSAFQHHPPVFGGGPVDLYEMKT